MKTVKNLVLLVFAGALLVSCGKVSYKKTPGGMPYKIFPGNDTTKIYAGSFIKMHLTQKIKDSVYFSSTETVPIYYQVTATAPQPYDLSEVWTKLKVGDSMEATQMMDTFINRSPQSVPPQFKKGDRIITYVKILGVFATDSAAKADGEKVKSEYLAKDLVKMEKWLADKKINTVKTPSGAYLEIINPGMGNLVDTGNYVTVKYTGMTWAGKKFDSNTDSSFHHVEPYSFTAGAGAMVKGFDEAILMMKKGSVVRVYIPSNLGWGDRPPQGSPMKPFENTIFDIEMVDIKDKAPAPPAQPQQPGQKVDVPQQK